MLVAGLSFITQTVVNRIVSTVPQKTTHHTSVASDIFIKFSLSILMAIFPGGPGLAGIRMSPFWILLEQRVMEVVVATGAIKRAKLQLSRHHQQTNAQLFTGWMPFLSPNQQ